jgi:hypothetical protein
MSNRADGQRSGQVPMPWLCVNELEAAYRAWRETHEEVFGLYRRFAKEAMSHGKPFSISLLTERIRWEIRSTWRKDVEGFKINNSHRAYIARDLIDELPELAGWIALRGVRGEDDVTLVHSIKEEAGL